MEVRDMSRITRLLDKVKKRQAPQYKPVQIPDELMDAEGDVQKKVGWVAPVYTISQSVQIDKCVCADNRCVTLLPGAPETDAYRVLRTHILQKTMAGKGNTIMVTSVSPGEGKTLTAINLAVIMAKDYNQTVLLVDCDLRKQNVHEVLGIESEKGLIDFLLDDVPVAELIQWPGVDKLTLISGGRPFHESSELLGSPRMKDLISDMKSRYPDRYVLFDTPPILGTADTLALIPLVDHVLVVVQAGKTPALEIARALDLIPKEKLLGLVLNRVKDQPESRYGYYPVRER
jgi:protein-tyrosine kinase